MKKKHQVQLSGGGEKNSLPIENLIKYDFNNINIEIYKKISNQQLLSDLRIKFDFSNKKINLSSYTIHSNTYITNSHAHLKM